MSNTDIIIYKTHVYYICILFHKSGVSEGLLFNANSEIIQLYHGENKLISNEMIMKSALLDQHA
jgi:hypothetical protein